jgi:hypothetical protein
MEEIVLSNIIFVPTYELTDEEVESAIHNWLMQSGSHILDKHPDKEPDIHIIDNRITILFEEVEDV